MAVLASIVWLIHDHHLRLRVQGGHPITVAEVREFLPETHRLVPDGSARAGLIAEDASGKVIGYAARTMPHTREVTGYSGPTDALLVLDAEDRFLGVTIRHSYDTPSHVEDVKLDYLFMEGWNGRTWDEVSRIEDLSDAEIYAVSGATRTSEALAWSLTQRARLGSDSKIVSPWRFRWQDALLLSVLASGLLFAFVKRPGLQKYRLVQELFVFIGLGLLLGDLLAQSLFIGWAQGGLPWRQTPGLVVLGLAAFLVPWGGGQPLYCHFLCPHGIAQRWIQRWVPARSLRLSKRTKQGLSTLPPILLFLVVIVVFLDLSFDLAGIEPFDAYLLTSAGIATITVAAVGLIASIFIPLAYCHYGCPTGWLFEFLRRRRGKDRFSNRDFIGLALLALALVLHQGYAPIDAWLFTPPAQP